MKDNVKILYLLKEGKKRKTYWYRVGVGFVNKDGSMNLKLDFFPTLNFQLRDAVRKTDRPVE